MTITLISLVNAVAQFFAALAQLLMALHACGVRWRR
jgi:hypothetical protein